MSKESQKMLKDIKANPCGFCWACHWKKQTDCYPKNPAQCSVCAVILDLIKKFENESKGDKTDG